MTNTDMLLLLSLIDRSPMFKNEYQLIKILEWKFHFFEHLHALNELIDKGHINRTNIGQIGFFEITDTGIAFLNENKTLVGKELIEKYPGERPFIEKLLSDVR